MYDCTMGSFQSLEGFSNDVLPRLRQDLNRHILRNQILLDQGTAKTILRIGRRRESDFNLFKAHVH